MSKSDNSLEIIDNGEDNKLDTKIENIPLSAEMETKIEPIDVGIEVSSTSDDSVDDCPIKTLDESDIKGIDLDKIMDAALEPAPQNLDSVIGYHTFRIDDLSKMLIEKERFKGPKFQIGNYVFNLILVCQRKIDFVLSMYLEGHPIDEKEGEAWSFPVHFTFLAWDPENPSQEKRSNTRFRFNQRVTDWGFVQFLDRRQSHDSHFFQNNNVNITVFVRIINDYTNVLYSDFRDYDSKKYTGYVGIRNQGATCYLNSLLQSYFFTKNFRKKVYQIPTEDEIKFDLGSYNDYKRQPKTVSLALQRIFYKLQTSDVAIDSLELTHSFGWTTADAFTQHDVQELNRILMDRLETKMKGTEIEDCLNDIFVGKMKSFIRCINVDYESSRTEDFWDIQLNVKGLKNIQESFENYVELEIMDGDNRYDASGYGLQDAEKGVIFEQFPDVLHVQLKRYEYDFETDNMAKINDRYEFSDSIDLKPYISKTSSVYDEDWEYNLHGVLIHQGDVSVGHYYAMIKVTEEDKWFKFDDDRVSRVTPDTVFEEGFGCGAPINLDRSMTREEQMNYIIKHQTSAYMLVYIRKTKVPLVLAEVQESDIPPHIPKQIKYEAEQEEQIRKERDEMHLYANFKVFTDETFSKYQGFDIGPNESDRRYFNEELFDESSFPVTFRMLKTDSWSSIYDVVLKQLGKKKKADQFRLWSLATRSNHTVRPDISIDDTFENIEAATVGDVCIALENGSARKRYSGPDRPMVLSMYLEDASKDLKHLATKSAAVPESVHGNERLQELFKLTDQDDDAKLEPINENVNMLAFIKYFSYEDQSIKGLSHIIIPLNTTTELLKQILEPVLGIADANSAVFYEELDFTKRQEIKPDTTLYKNEIGTGDIICMGMNYDNQDDSKYSNLLEFYGFMDSRICFQFVPLETVDEDEEDYVFIDNTKKLEVVDAWISYHSKYIDLTTVIGEKIGVPPEYIKLSTISNGKKNDLKVEYDFASALSNVPKQQVVRLSYEILNIPVLEFEGMELCHVYWVGNGICKEERHDFFLPRSSTLENVIDKLSSKVNFNIDAKDDIFCWIPDHYRKVKSILNLDDTVDGSMYMIMGLFPQFTEVMNQKSSDVVLVPGFQCYSSSENTHGLPFVFDIVKGEKLVDSLARLRKLLGLSENEFKFTKIALSHQQGLEYLDPASQSLDLFTCKKKLNFSLVVDHPDRKLRHGSYQSSIKIM